MFLSSIQKPTATALSIHSVQHTRIECTLQVSAVMSIISP